MMRAIVMAAFVCGACAADEGAPQSLIAQPRILALRADPPVVAFGGAARLDALVVDGRGRQVEASVVWRACDPWSFTLDPDIDCGPGASLTIDAVLEPAAVLGRFAPPTGMPPPPAEDACESLLLPVIAEVIVDGERLVAIKRVPVTAAESGERNPVVAGIALNGEVEPPSYRAEREYDVSVASLTAGSEPDCDDGPALLAVNVYASAGEVDDGRVSVEPQASETAPVVLTSWLAPATDSSILWIVAIDGNGGVAWSGHELRRR